MIKNTNWGSMTERSRSKRTVFQELAVRDRQTARKVQRVENADRSTPWINLTLLNGFYNYGYGWAIAAVKRHSSGLVELKGLVAAGAAPAPGTAIAVLPVGFRPYENRLISCDAQGGHGRFDVYPNGILSYVYGAVGYYSIERVFSAEQ